MQLNLNKDYTLLTTQEEQVTFLAEANTSLLQIANVSLSINSAIEEKLSTLPKLNFWNILKHYKEIILAIEFIVQLIKNLKTSLSTYETKPSVASPIVKDINSLNSLVDEDFS